MSTSTGRPPAAHRHHHRLRHLHLRHHRPHPPPHHPHPRPPRPPPPPPPRPPRPPAPAPPLPPPPRPPAAPSASAATSTSAATSATGPLPCPEGARAATRRREAQDPQGALLGRTHSPRSLEALATRACGQPVTAARHDQAPELPGQAGGRSKLDRPFTTKRGRPHGGRPLFWRWPLNRLRQWSAQELPGPAGRRRR